MYNCLYNKLRGNFLHVISVLMISKDPLFYGDASLLTRITHTNKHFHNYTAQIANWIF